jgi:hypothetical protein
MMILAAHFAFDIRLYPSHVYMLYAALIMIIVLEPCYEVMNHYVLSHHCLFVLLYVSFAYTSYLSPYHDLMV